MAKISTKDWRNLPIADWNTTTFHEYLKDRNREAHQVDYVPFGRGPISNRWSTEKGQLKNAINKYGNEVILAFIDKCFENHKFNPAYPTLSFGFIYAYLRTELERAEVDVRKRQERARIIEETPEVDDEWF
jgi:hypothetical protein